MKLINYEDIVTNFKNPTIVLAGPGTGKTHLLADRIKRLLDASTDKNTITAITFSTDADQEMKNRLSDPTKEFKIKYSDLPHISTMHSLGFTIVNEKPHAVKLKKTSLQVQDKETVKELMYRDASLILGFDQAASQEALKCKQVGDCQRNSQIAKCKICAKYREIMSKCNCIDFDDQILFACEILEKNPDILAKYQAQTKHLLVDEYQDINKAQFRLIELLSKESVKGLFVVGDDAQSIYSFRGCSPRFILQFVNDFNDADDGTLKISRRCHKSIMEDSFKVLLKYYKDWSGRPDLHYEFPDDGEIPKVFQLSSELLETRMAASIARRSLNDNKSVLVLVPKRDFFGPLTREFAQRGIAYDCTESFLPERIEILMRLMDWIKNPDSNFPMRLVLEDLINNGIAKVPGIRKDRRCTPKTIQNRINEETKVAKLWEGVDARNSIFKIVRSNKGVDTTLCKIRDSLTNISDLFNNIKGNNRGEFIKQLAITTGIWTSPLQFDQDLSLVASLLQPQHPTTSRLAKLRTMRKAKGLEADVVIILGLESGIFPDPRAEDIAEEARLFYVSMTRARESLYLFHSFRRPRNLSYETTLMDKDRSEFLDAIGRASEYKQFKS